MSCVEAFEKGEFDSPTRYEYNGLTIRPFDFIGNYSHLNSHQLLGRYTNWKKPRIQKGKRWLVKFSYRIPGELQHLYGNKKWKVFEVFKEINRYKTDDYAQLLLASVEEALKNGYNPFEERKDAVKKALQEAEGPSNKIIWSCVHAFNLFKQEWKKRGLEQVTLNKLSRGIELFSEWLRKRKLLQEPASKITRKWVEQALQEESQREGWTNRTYNNNVTALSTVFNFLLDEKIIPENPTKKIPRKKAKAQKHRYYDPQRFTKVREIMEQQDPLLHFAAKLVYYLCIRSEKELKHFKVENIFPDRRQVFIQAEESKTDTDRFIPIPDELMEELADIRTNYPGNYYVVGKGARIKYVKHNTPSPKPFAANMLSARFMKIRQVAGLTSNHTIYSFKHTRIIHLKQDRVSDADIMHLTGHTSYQAFAEYLRDLGVSGNPETVNKATRKF